MTYEEFLKSLTDEQRFEFLLKGELVLDNITYKRLQNQKKSALEAILGMEIESGLQTTENIIVALEQKNRWQKLLHWLKIR